MDRLHYNVGFRLYVGNSNWINLSPKMTADFIEIWKKGQPTKYKLAPGLSIDILPNDVDCNSKTTDLPMLMRADLCYDKEAMYEHTNDDDDNLNNKDKDNNYITLLQQPKTLNERKEIVQQRLSLFVKNILDSQGIIDAFPPTSSSDDILPPIFNIPTHRHLGLIPVIAKLAKRITNLKVVPSPSTNDSTFSTTLTSFPSSSRAYTESDSIQSENHHQPHHHHNKKGMDNDNNKNNSKKGKGKTHSTNNHKLYRKSKNIKKKLINKKTQLASSPYYFRASTYAVSSLTTTEENNNTLTTSPTSIFMESTLTTLYNNNNNNNNNNSNSDDQLNQTTTPDTTTSFDWLPTYSNPNPPLSYQKNAEVPLIPHNNDNNNEDNNSDIYERKSISSITTRSIDSKTNDFFQPLDIGTPVLSNDSIIPLINYRQINHHHHHHRRENEIKNSNNDTNHHQHNDNNNNIDSFWYDSTNEHQQQTIVSAQPNLLSSSPLPPIPTPSSSSFLYPTHHQHQYQRMSMYPSSEYSFNTYPDHEYHNLQTNTSHYNNLSHSPTLCHYQDTSHCEQSSMTHLFHSTHKLTNEANHPTARTKSLRRPSIESAVTF